MANQELSKFPGGQKLRILLVTDAWAPQINGVVVTLTNTVKWLERWGHEVRVISPEGFKDFPDAHVPGDPARDHAGRESGPDHPGIQSRCSPHRDRRPARSRGAFVLREASHELHNRIPHVLPGIREAALRHPAGHYLHVASPLPWGRLRDPGGHARDQENARGTGLSQHRRLVAWRRYGALHAGPRALQRPAAAGVLFRRSRRGREEPARIPRARPAGHQARRR